MIREKPIPQAYKMLALCEYSYTFSFILIIQSESFSDILDIYQGVQVLSPTVRVTYDVTYSNRLDLE